ncbi:unnamed protein product [Rotaria magnacalcarata]|uniref:Uncharacterized protein n=2 Tax=Rotaria magnacalcarata TaxID=392030 RepID=A0A814EEH8_9BILA|nr:unnamed protein product [Rotaria magnacalcarata]CAF3857256.1 unnamed protein product [Rotaria magnacalcarata]CAF3981484.1 unnamed protein product [Rotaria magnacalcarata]
MVAEGVNNNNNNNGHNNDHLSGNEYEILEQGSISNVQVESISRFLSEYPEAALSQQQIVQPVNSTPKRGHPLDESGSSINNGRGRRKYPLKGIDNNANKQSQYVQQEINLQPQQPSTSMSSGERQQQVINQASTNRKRISFNQLKHAVPDSFALVVRYVPRELEENFVSNEIQRTIASADRIKRIHYSYQRRTDDYRFDVKDYSGYDAVLQLGRIAIGHSWLSITKVYPGNRLTYCTKCWCIDHLRNKCNSENKYRICLENVRVATPHMCKNEPKCDGNHHSLDNQCQVIKEYKDHLKEDVEDAIQKGLLQWLSLQEKSPMFELRDQDFSPLTTSDNHSDKRWNIAQPRTTVE